MTTSIYLESAMNIKIDEDDESDFEQEEEEYDAKAILLYIIVFSHDSYFSHLCVWLEYLISLFSSYFYLFLTAFNNRREHFTSE